MALRGFGSSSTEIACHNMGRHSWFCWLSRTVRENAGKHVTMINSGVCGDTTRELLARFDRDVRPLAPSAVLVTIGGNDQARPASPKQPRVLTCPGRALSTNYRV